jgi:hypothetical protein
LQLPADQYVSGALFVATCHGERALHERFIKSHGKYHGTRIG